MIDNFDEIIAFLHEHKDINAGNAQEIVDYLLPKIADWELFDMQYFCQIIIHASEALKVLGELKAAERLFTEQIERYSNTYQYGYLYKSHMYHNLGICRCELGMRDEALDAFKHHVYYSLINNAAYGDFEFYTFRRCSDYAIKDLKEATITVANPKTFNDPFDCRLYAWMDVRKEEATKDGKELAYELMQEAYNYIKIRSFIRNKPLPSIDPDVKSRSDVEERYNMLMWSHYADSHKGYCVKYVIPSEFTCSHDHVACTTTAFFNINYVKVAKPLAEGLNIEEGLYTKSDVWEYENEARLLHYDPYYTTGNVERDKYKGLKIDKTFIKEIYFGLQCSDTDKQRIREALADAPHVKFYQITCNPANVYRLTSEECK